MNEKTYKSKIGRIPYEIRNQLNRRIRDNEPASAILPWINSLQPVQDSLSEWSNGAPISEQNLSEWRRSGFLDWLEGLEEIQATRELNAHALSLAHELGGNFSDTAAAIIAGKLAPVLAGNIEIEDVIRLSPVLNALTNVDRKRLDAAKIAQKDRDLNLEERKFKLRFAEMFLDFYDKKQALEIASSPTSHSQKLEALVDYMNRIEAEAETT